MFIFASGERYEGGFSRGRKQGKGIYNYLGGDIFNGHFKADRAFKGEVHYLHSGERYVGTFNSHEQKHG